MRSPGYQRRLGNDYTVTFPDYPSITRPPKYIRIHQKTGAHDVVELNYTFNTTFLSNNLSTGVPVRVVYRNDKIKAQFVGYVAHVKYPTVQTVERITTVVCVGASYPLKNHGSTVWTDKSAPEIVTNIASKFKLTPVTTASPIKFRQQSLAGQSYWEKIQDLCHRTGYVAQVIGTELHFHTLDKMIAQFMSSIPVMMFRNDYTYPYNSEVAPTLDMFQPKLGDFIESEGTKRTDKVSAGVDPVTGAIHSHVASPNKVGKNMRSKTKPAIFTEINTGDVSESKAAAKAWAEAKAQHARFSIPAKGAGQGDPRIAPYRTVEIQGTGDSTDGFWVITKAEHFLHLDGRYQVEFECMSDGLGPNSVESNKRANGGFGVVASQVSLPGIGDTLVRNDRGDRIPTRNITDGLSGSSMGTGASTTGVGPGSPVAPIKLSGAVPLIKEGENGFTIAPRTWVGRKCPNGQSCCHSA